MLPSLVLIVIAGDEGTNVDAFELSPAPLLLILIPMPDDAETLPIPETAVREECAVEGRSWSSSMWRVCTYGASSLHESSSIRTGVGSTVPSSR